MSDIRFGVSYVEDLKKTIAKQKAELERLRAQLAPDLGVDQSGGEAGGMYTRSELIQEVERLRQLFTEAEGHRDYWKNREKKRTAALEAEVERLRLQGEDDNDQWRDVYERKCAEVERLHAEADEAALAYRDEVERLRAAHNIAAGDAESRQARIAELEAENVFQTNRAEANLESYDIALSRIAELEAFKRQVEDNYGPG